MADFILKQGQKIDAIHSPPNGPDDEGFVATVGHNQITEIEIGQCRGPMGFYDVAIIRRGGVERPDELMPVHMAEYVRLLPGDSQ